MRPPAEQCQVDPDNVFPEYYLIDVDQFNNVVQSEIDEWIYFFKNSRVREDFDFKNMNTLRQKLDLLHMDTEERKAYEHYVMNLVSLRGMIEIAKEKHARRRPVNWPISCGKKACTLPTSQK